MSTTTLGQPPSDPRTISFDPRCFVVVGETVEFVVVHNAHAVKSPERFADEAEAHAFAARRGLVVRRDVSQKKRRVSWT